jgi:hypothetical protein
MNYKYAHTDKDTWTWYLAYLNDSNEIERLIEEQYESEVDPMFISDYLQTLDKPRTRMEVESAMIRQRHSLETDQVIVAKDKTTNKLLAWAWVGRGRYSHFSKKEMAEAKFAHIDLNLPLRTRIKLTYQIIHHWILWCHLHRIPILVSTSMRAEYEGFMKIHKTLGFLVRGSIAWKRIDNDTSI